MIILTYFGLFVRIYICTHEAIQANDSVGPKSSSCSALLVNSFALLFVTRRVEETYICFDMILLAQDDTLILTDPPRGIVLADEVYFETDLKIRCDGGATKDFSKGVIYLSKARLPVDKKTIKVGLSSCLSRVEVECEDVVRPVEATIAITILKGACNLGQVSAWAEGNHRQRIILYSSGDSGRAAGGPVALARRVVAVPVDKKVVVSLVSLTDECNCVDGLTEEGEDAVITLRPSYQGRVYKMGWGQVQVQIVWTAVPKSNKYKMDVVGNVTLLH